MATAEKMPPWSRLPPLKGAPGSRAERRCRRLPAPHNKKMAAADAARGTSRRPTLGTDGKRRVSQPTRESPAAAHSAAGGGSLPVDLPGCLGLPTEPQPNRPSGTCLLPSRRRTRRQTTWEPPPEATASLLHYFTAPPPKKGRPAAAAANRTRLCLRFQA
ncbi:uncharacterized protein LOC143834124 [Paroedura picta]|uniref:uncharacterized protein LOC143834124 n=1 Tax=Paroedura picta TaxID=143630 RepID=UPI004056D22D